jgi:hypothetical protein
LPHFVPTGELVYAGSKTSGHKRYSYSHPVIDMNPQYTAQFPAHFRIFKLEEFERKNISYPQ